MKAFTITNIGTEDISKLEINELIGRDASISRGCCTFGFDDYKELVKLAYYAQSTSKICILLNHFSSETLEDIKKNSEKLDLGNWLTKENTFRVRSTVIFNDSFQSIDIEPLIGEKIIESVEAKKGFRPKVNLEDPEIEIFCYVVGDKAYIGIDFTGGNLSKRDYNLFVSKMQIRPTIAYSAIRRAGFSKGKVLVDPFSRSGTIPIEAALYASGISIHKFTKDKFNFLRLGLFSDDDIEKMFSELENKDEEGKHKKNKNSNAFGCDDMLRNIKAAQKNAKIAGLSSKDISFMKVDLSWLDTKFEKESVDCIVTVPPETTKFSDKKEIEKKHSELFYHADYILKKDGSIVLITRKPEELIEKSEKFKVVDNKEVMQGKEKYSIVIFRRK